MAFRFRLQRLLDYRHEREKEAKQQLALLQKRKEQKDQVLQKLESDHGELLTDSARKQAEELDLPMMMGADDFRHYLQGEIDLSKEALVKAEGELNKQSQETRQRWRSRKVLERLREKAQSGYLQEEKIAEQRLSDDLTLGRYGR